MSMPRGCAKGSDGFLFMLRTRDEVRNMSNEQLEERYRQVRAHMSPEAAGLEFMSTYTRNIAIAERRSLVNEMARRADHAHR